MGQGFDIFQQFAVKFPAHGQIIPVKWNQISSPRAAHYTAKYPKAGSKKGTIKISPNKNLKSLFILRCCITKVTRKGRELREGKHMFGLSLFRPSWQSNPVEKNISTSGEERIEYTASLGEQGQSNALSQGQQRQSNPHPMPCLPTSRRHNIDRCITLRLRDFFSQASSCFSFHK